MANFKNILTKIGLIIPLVLNLSFPSANLVFAAAPVIANVNAINIMGSGAQITWTTDIPSNSKVFYGTNPSSHTNSSTWSCETSGAINGMATNHCINLTNLNYGAVYYYIVKSEDSSGVYSVSLEKTFTSATNSYESANTTAITIPAAPSNLRSAGSATTSITLVWNDNSANEDKFNLERKLSTLDSSAYSRIIQTSGNITTYADASVAAGTNYDYRIQACLSGSGCSDYVYVYGLYAAAVNDAATITTDTNPPSNPSALSIYSNTPDSVTLQWTAPGDDGSAGAVSGYEIKYSAMSQGSITLNQWWDYAAVAANTTYNPSAFVSAGNTQKVVISSLSSGYTYYFAIKAKDENSNWSGPSGIIPATTAMAATSGSGGANTTIIPSINLSYPNGGEILKKEQTYDIKWQSSDLSSITIKLMDYSSSQSGTYYHSIANDINALLGNYYWLIPSNIPSGSHYKIRIGNETTIDYSDNYFTIEAPVVEQTAITSGFSESSAIESSSVYNTDTATDTKITALPLKETIINIITSTIDAAIDIAPLKSPAIKQFAPEPIIKHQQTAKQENPFLIIIEETTLENELLPFIKEIEKPAAGVEEIKQNIIDISSRISSLAQPKEIEILTSEYLAKTAGQPEKIIKTEDIFKKDSDQDNVSDYQELMIYKTDPFNRDSDKDGHNDDVEIIQGNDPKDSSITAKIVFEDARTAGQINAEIFEIKEVELIVPEKIAPAPTEEIVLEPAKPIEPIPEATTAIRLAGKSLPNSFITLYIYSDPLIVQVKTDEYGNWSYVLDKPLEQGKHEVYTAITDNTGKILAKSQPFSFIKEAQAITLATVAETAPTSAPSQTYFKLSIIGLIFGALLIALLFIIKATKKTNDPFV